MAGMLQGKFSKDGESKGGKPIYREHWSGGVEVMGRYYMPDGVVEALRAPEVIYVTISTDAKVGRDAGAATTKRAAAGKDDTEATGT